MSEARPDLAAMRASIPQPETTSVEMQATAQRAVEKPYLDLAGSRFYLDRIPDMFDLAELGEAVDAAEKNPMQALGTINRMLRESVADYDGLKRKFRETGGGVEEYAKLGLQLFETVTARPTEAPADSSDGRSSTSTSSKAAAPSAELQTGSLIFTPGSS